MLKYQGQAETGVFVSTEQFPSIGASDIEFLQQAVADNMRGRVRISTHKTIDDRMHEMFICFTGVNYVRPSRHVGKDESLHMINGEGEYFFFDETGQVTDQVSIGRYGSDRPFYCRIPEMHQHALVIRTPFATFHESTPGPFAREATVFSDWSPDEGDPDAVAGWLGHMRQKKSVSRPNLGMERTAEEVFVASDPIVFVGSNEIDLLKSEVEKTARKRVRLCAHKTIENTLHEMFVVYMSMTYVKPNKHIGKDESLHILEGEADFVFFSEGGDIQSIVPLGTYDSGRQFYLRVPAGVYHTLVMRSDRLVIHEVTPGPFRREDTVWAPWAPEESQPREIEKFMAGLSSVVG